MEMITAKGDTVEVQRIKELKLITISDQSFLLSYNVGYLEILHRPRVSLGVMNLMVPVSKKDASVHPYLGSVNQYDYKSSTSFEWGKSPKGFYYLVDKDNNLHKATSQSIRKLFYDQKKQVRAYLAQNPVDFESKDDLIRLLVYCDSLDIE